MRSAYQVTNFINQNISIKQFYHFVTMAETNFNYDINSGGRCGWTALQAACDRTNLPLINALLAMGANPNLPRDDGYTPLYDAIKSGNLEAVKLLRQHGARLDFFGRDYLGLAHKEGHLEIADYLTSTLIDCEREFLENKELQVGNRATTIYKIGDQFREAIKNNAYQAVETLLDSNIHARNIYFDLRNYSIRVAAIQGNMKMVRLLVKHGGYIMEDDTGKPIPQIARKAGHNDIAIFLENTQQERYQRLKSEVTKQKEITKVAQNKYYQFSIFHDAKRDDLALINNQANTNIQLTQDTVAERISLVK